MSFVGRTISEKSHATCCVRRNLAERRHRRPAEWWPPRAELCRRCPAPDRPDAEPPRPRAHPVAFAKISAIMARRSPPFARWCPCERCPPHRCIVRLQRRADTSWNRLLPDRDGMASALRESGTRCPMGFLGKTGSGAWSDRDRWRRSDDRDGRTDLLRSSPWHPQRHCPPNHRPHTTIPALNRPYQCFKRQTPKL